MPKRPDQGNRGNIPLSPGGQTVAQMLAAGLLTQADMVALGLATEVTLGTVHTETAGTNTGVATALTAGIPPGIPNVDSTSSLRKTATSSPYTLKTFASAGRIWAVTLAYTLAANASYSGATNHFYCQVTAGGVVLTVLELSVTINDDIQSDSISLQLGGIAVVTNDKIILDVNNGVDVSNCAQRASVAVIWSIP